MDCKKKIIIISLIILSVIFVGCGNGNDTVEPDINSSEEVIAYGAKGARNDENMTIESMLEYAIEDEFLARKEYELIMETFGEQRPFSNIMKAEETHIGMLKELYEDYGLELPNDSAEDHVIVPDTLDECFRVGVQAEIENIAMYEKFLKEELPEDIRNVFEALRNASQSHLKAFEKNIK